ncbi:thiosulfate oxidation carrier protein SoxY [Limnohabitans sp.]|uniref:thiosulfate oxidation carrier protein SoxY n=1 Tax=Limnohabitans sp. TaxID=1907725 RepID=UPI00286EEB42|nr:thiosulfate oxidation carrier protein SoxY [Limnohabitans sp.]
MTKTSRRQWLKHTASMALASAALQGDLALAQKMESGQLQTLAQMMDPIIQGAKLLRQDVTLTAQPLADNGFLVPIDVHIQSPMTAQDHVTQVYLLSQRNPVTRMAVFHMGPWNGRAEINTRIRLAGTQTVVALARLSNGEFRYDAVDIIVTESACVDAS